MNSFRKATSGTLGRCLSKGKDSKGVKGLLWILSRTDASHGIPASALSSYMLQKTDAAYKAMKRGPSR
jgi:hypothetical protein